MQQSRICDHYVIARESNVVRVDFARGREPPEPQFSGAGALPARDAGHRRLDRDRELV